LVRPRVGNSPIIKSFVGGSPSDDFNGMPSQILSGLVDIDSRGVLVEISINLESSFNGSVGHNFGLNCCNISGNRVGRLSVEEILSIRGGSSIVGDALLGAGRGSFFLRGAFKTTRRNKVWLTPLVVSVSVS
jgi:hypothetical protein